MVESFLGSSGEPYQHIADFVATLLGWLQCAESPVRSASMVQRQIRLLSRSDLSPRVAALRFELTDDLPWSFEPGQWANLNLPGRDHDDRRAYSIAGVDRGGAGGAVVLEFAITLVDGGCLSPALHRMVPGDIVLLDGPHGFFTRTGAQTRLATLMVATGSGFAPLRPMLQQALADPQLKDVPLTLLFGCRTPADQLYRDQLRRWAALHGNFEYLVSLSRPDDTWSGLVGYVQQHLPELVARRPVEQVYVCGLSAMVRDVRATLKPLGFGRGTVHTERFD